MLLKSATELPVLHFTNKTVQVPFLEIVSVFDHMHSPKIKGKSKNSVGNFFA